MAKRVPKTFIEDLIQRTDIVALIGSKVVLRKKSGDNHTACCPFHNDKTPSFTVNERKQFYYCFGCHKGGDVLRFLMDFDQLTFVEAVEALAIFNGVTVPYEESSVDSSLEVKVRLEQGLACLEEAVTFFHAQFYAEVGQEARQYLRARKLNKRIVDDFKIGYAPNNNALLKMLSSRYPLDLLCDVGLVGTREGEYYDWFRDRILFPICNARGQVIAFGARAMGNAQPKYLNSGESNWFNKRNELYGLYQALKHKEKTLIVNEGYLDVVKMAQFGFTNTVATLGTAVGGSHIAQLKKYARKVYFCFDGDKAGNTAAEKALQAVFSAHDEDHEWRFVFLPKGEDPDSLLTSVGRDAMHQCLDASLSPSQFLFKLLSVEQKAYWTSEEHAKVARTAADWLNILPQGQYKEILRKDLESALGVTIMSVQPDEQSSVIRERYPRIVSPQATMPQRLEWRLIGTLALHPEWSMMLPRDTDDIEAEVPLFYTLCYHARAGATCEDLQHMVVEEYSGEEELQQAFQALSLLSLKEIEKEFFESIMQIVERAKERRRRLEKLGISPDNTSDLSVMEGKNG